VRLLVTRPEADSAALADELATLGHSVLTEPLLDIRPTGTPLALDGIAAVLLTSANGARALAAAATRRDIPVYAVGAATAATARSAGFTTVESADGDAASLAALVRSRREPGEGALLHAAGAARAGDLAGDLRKAGFAVRVEILYEAVPAASLSRAARAAIAEGRLDGVLLFSPRTARLFAALVDRAGLDLAAGALDAYCLSREVADALGSLPFRRIRVAAQPTRRALIACLATDSSEERRA
jgi:uroporphyrinogen-III synthase